MIVITGGLGYVGSHIALELLRAGREVVSVDNGSNVNDPRFPIVDGLPGHLEVIQRDCSWLENTYMHNVEAVFHCAGSISVSESVEMPLEYYENNVSETIAVARFAVNNGVPFIGFSSTAALTGTAKTTPYARSKEMGEHILRDVTARHGIRFGLLRYFNVAGADSELRAGENSIYIGHLIKRIAVAIAHGEDEFWINGQDFDTLDGTAIRDFIHPTDVARAHIRQLDGAPDFHEKKMAYEIGSGYGYSVAYIINAARRAFPEWQPVIRYGKPRDGDVARLVANPQAAYSDLGWRPSFSISDIITSAVEFERKLLDDRGNGTR